ncbi:MAG: hypothetical protein QME42_05140 [bacterium]|nr:hypothetical protein [bacterium]
MKRMIVLILFLLCVRDAGAIMGLQTYFAKVLIENLNIGGTYSTKKLVNLPLNVLNTGEEEVNLKIETIIPAQGELDEGYEAIPDTSWIKVEKDTFFDVKSQEAIVTDVIITIPDDERYSGKRFEAFIWSHTVAKGGIGFGVGLKSKLLFTISNELPLKEACLVEACLVEACLVEEKEIPTIGSLNFKVEPGEIYVENVICGTVTSCGAITITNSGTQTLSYMIKSIPVGTYTMIADKGYELCPDPTFLKIKGEEFVLAGGEKKEVNIAVEFAGKEEYKGKKYMFLLHITQNRVGYYTKVFVSVQPSGISSQ